MYNYYDEEKMIKSYKQNYRVVKSKRKLRLSQIEIEGQIDELTRKKLIKKILRGEDNNV